MPQHLGEFEHVVLLAILQTRADAYALAIVRELDQRAGRNVDRGALYKTLDRLEAKGLVTWSLEETTPDRGGHRRRRFAVTNAGLEALRASREVLFQMWDGLNAVLDGTA